MVNIRNKQCLCGSGKKYKKCCFQQFQGIATNAISSQLESKLDAPCWYHGTEHHFDSWLLPPPSKPGQSHQVPHTALFFTSNIDFAKGAGTNIASVSLSSKFKILDATANYLECEKLRLEVKRNDIAAKTHNIDHDYWHSGWKTGDVLRMAFTDAQLFHHLEELIVQHVQEFGMTPDQANACVMHNCSRGLIELICVSAQRLGYDALYGHEVDRHSIKNQKIAQPWLAVFNNNAISTPQWIVS